MTPERRGPTKVSQRKTRRTIGTACVGLALWLAFMGLGFDSWLPVAGAVFVLGLTPSLLSAVRRHQERSDPTTVNGVVRRKAPARIDPVTKLPVQPTD